MDSHDLQKTLENLVEPVFSARGVELVELVLSGGPRRRLVRIYADRPEGITIGECAELSRHIADVFDTCDPIEGTYTLEVSSPGLTRPLKSDRDFQRAVGKSVKVLIDGAGDRVGILQGVQAQHLELMVDGKPMAVEKARIQKAQLHFDF